MITLALSQPVIKDTANPDWSTAFTIDYLFEVAQEVTFR